MPQIEDLPLVAQNQLRVIREREREGQAAASEPRRRSLLEKLAAFGITRHDEEPAPKAGNPAAPPPAAPQRIQSAPVAHAEFGRPQSRPQPLRPSAAALEPQERPAPRPPVTEDDQLDIPAFLRRHPN